MLGEDAYANRSELLSTSGLWCGLTQTRGSACGPYTEATAGLSIQEPVTALISPGEGPDDMCGTPWATTKLETSHVLGVRAAGRA